ncbi:flagellar biosynthesis protein FlhB [Entomohabitans teleogrylli]|uniref:flagellar biosynthesis protein FlhB n=1 Tax=Entomohabitans teleogrylli TaxID=1384589 RepID=UPI00073DB5B5|nr:flagellar biosynthesis protein FlhB [Entomohabitans teleogrylli]
MSEHSDQEKTEDPTPHRLEKAREEGQIPRSRELTGWLMLLAGLSILWVGGEGLARSLAALLAGGLRFDHRLLSDSAALVQQMALLLSRAAWALLPLIVGLVLVAIGAPMLLGGVVLSGKSLQFSFSKLNPLSGLKRLFSAQTAAELLKTLLKAALVGWVAGIWLWHNWPEMLRLIAEPPLLALKDALNLVAFSSLLVVLGLVPMVAFDVFWQVRSHLKKLRMTRQDIRDEFKEQEGDPHVKGRIRQQQRAAARRRMMASVPTADVIVTNPTHYAVALRYRENQMSAPQVVAKGAGLVALHIRELAVRHRVAQLEAPALARALYRHAEIGQQIPTQLYAAVAEVLAWVWQLRRWRQVGGMQPPKPANLPVPAALDFLTEKDTDD